MFGVEADDELNIRSLPGTDQDIIGTAAPTADDLVATGRARQLPRSFWYEVNHGGVTGWVSVAFVAYEGGTDDATADDDNVSRVGQLVVKGYGHAVVKSEHISPVVLQL